jgi:hypothetical protein
MKIMMPSWLHRGREQKAPAVFRHIAILIHQKTELIEAYVQVG